VLAEPIKSVNFMMAKLITSARNPALNSLLTAVSARQMAAFRVRALAAVCDLRESCFPMRPTVLGAGRDGRVICIKHQITP
jgi:hypothetical protein